MRGLIVAALVLAGCGGTVASPPSIATAPPTPATDAPSTEASAIDTDVGLGAFTGLAESIAGACREL